MVNTLEVTANAPTAFERALDDWSRRAPGSELASLAMHRMVIALAQELADEREIVRGQAEVIQRLLAVDHLRAAHMQEMAGHIFDARRRCSLLEEASTTETLTAVSSDPATTERFMFKTVKEGTRLDEASITFAWPGLPDPAVREAIFIENQNAGQREAALRNAPPVADEDGGL